MIFKTLNIILKYSQLLFFIFCLLYIFHADTYAQVNVQNTTVRASVVKEIDITFSGTSGPRNDNLIVLSNQTSNTEFGSFSTNSSGVFLINLLVAYASNQVLCLQAVDIGSNKSAEVCFEISIENDVYVFNDILLMVPEGPPGPIDPIDEPEVIDEITKDKKKTPGDVTDEKKEDLTSIPVDTEISIGETPRFPILEKPIELIKDVIYLPPIVFTHLPSSDILLSHESDTFWVVSILALKILLLIIIWIKGFGENS